MKDRLPPHSIEGEQGVLGCCLLDPKNALTECQSKAIRGEMFYDLRHQTIFDALCAMQEKGLALDMIGVCQYLKDRNQLEGVGSAAYISTLPDATPSVWNLPMYLGILKEKYVLRRMLNLCTDVAANIHEHQGEVQPLLDHFETEALRIGDAVSAAKELAMMKELVMGAISRMEQRIYRPNEMLGLPTGFHDLDHYFKGLRPGQMVVIAARPSIGKTSLAMNIAENTAVKQAVPTGVFELEMTSDDLTDRMASSMAKVNLNNLMESDCQTLTVHLSKLSKAPLYIDDTSGLSITQLRARARRMVQRYGVKLIIIDYLQLMSNTSKRGENRQSEITQISNGIKQLAKELMIPIIVLSQLNRDIERDKNRKPRLSDLRESGSIEQDADIVAILYNEKSDEENSAESIIPVNCLIAKNRNGAKGEVHLTFFKEFTKFEQAAKPNYIEV